MRSRETFALIARSLPDATGTHFSSLKMTTTKTTTLITLATHGKEKIVIRGDLVLGSAQNRKRGLLQTQRIANGVTDGTRTGRNKLSRPEPYTPNPKRNQQQEHWRMRRVAVVSVDSKLCCVVVGQEAVSINFHFLAVCLVVFAHSCQTFHA